MEKTKLGISVGLMAALVYLMGLISGYTVTILLIGYIFLKEENAWLKKQSVSALVLMLAFSLVSVVIGVIPDVFGVFNSLIGIFGGYLHMGFMDNLLNIVHNVLGVIKTFVFILLALSAGGKGKFNIPALDKFVDKIFD